jgi:hypothetical protein
VAGRQVTIQFLGDARSFTSATCAMGRSTTTLGDKLKRVGKAAMIGFAGAAVLAGKAAYDMAEAAAEDQKQAALLANTLKNTTGRRTSRSRRSRTGSRSRANCTASPTTTCDPPVEAGGGNRGSITKAQKLPRWRWTSRPAPARI